MKNKTPKQGILMFAHNNQEIDYLRLAIINSYLIQKNLKLDSSQITVVTDHHSYDYVKTTIPEKMMKAACKYIFVETDFQFKHSNKRTFKDTYSNPKTLPFYNKNRCDAYDLTPYDETIMIDVDYLIFSNALNQCWGHKNELMLNWQYYDVMAERVFPDLGRLNPLGITMYWATVVYFRKSEFSEMFFETVKHVRDHKEYYKDLYQFAGGVYRNDFSFSIAAHVMGGFKDKNIPQLPVRLYKTFDNDDIYKAEYDRLYLYLEKPRSPGDFMLTAWDNMDIHIMNKWAINRIGGDLLKYYMPKISEENIDDNTSTSTAATKTRNTGTKTKKKRASTRSKESVKV